MGPVGLKADAPEIPAAAVNFDFGTEGEIAHYRTPAGPVMLAVFSFPLPSMARQQLPQFQKITGATAKRTRTVRRRRHWTLVSLGQASRTSKLSGVVAENEKPPEKPLELKPESAGKDGSRDFQPGGTAFGILLAIRTRRWRHACDLHAGLATQLLKDR